MKSAGKRKAGRVETGLISLEILILRLILGSFLAAAKFPDFVKVAAVPHIAPAAAPAFAAVQEDPSAIASAASV